MRKLFTIITAVLITASAFTQSPEKMSYQAVIRDASNALVTNQAVGMQISILQGSVSGTAVYVETQTPNTNINGLVSTEIGSGTVVSGTFNTMDWSNGPYFIKTETDPTGGTIYTVSGTSQLLSVPYALHSKTAEGITGTITETDPVFGASVANAITVVDTANWNNKLDTEVDGSATNEIQDLNSVLTQGSNAGANNITNVNQLGVGITNPATSAAVDLSVSGRALLVSQLTTVQRDALTPVPGMIIYNSTVKEMQGYVAASTELLDLESPIGDIIFVLSSTQAYGQSFVPEKSGVLTKVQIKIPSATVNGTFAFKLFDGNGTAGTLLHTQNVNLLPSTVTVTLSAQINVIKGNLYTFEFSTAGSGNLDIKVCTFDYYYPGRLYQNGTPFSSYDMWFRTFVTPSAQWINLGE